jgi:hypothetical protein
MKPRSHPSSNVRLIQAVAYAIGMLHMCGHMGAELEVLTPSSIRSWEATNKTRKEFKESAVLPKPAELPKSWVKIFDTLKAHLRNRQGDASKVCLLYLIRDDATPIDADLDPGTKYVTLEPELITRCPHWEMDDNDNLVRPPYYEPDSQKLWMFLFEIFQNRHAASYTYMHLFEEAEDGRGAYLALRSHHLGKSNIAALALEAKRSLGSLRYHGETHNFNFETYVNAHIQ